MQNMYAFLAVLLIVAHFGYSGEEPPDGETKDGKIEERALHVRLLDEPPSDHHIEDVLNAWWAMKQVMSLKHIGITLLSTFLKLYPEYIAHYSEFRTVPIDELPQNPKFVAQAVRVMYSLASVMDNLDDTTLVTETMLKLGRIHAMWRISEQAFFDMRNLMLHLISRYQKQHAHQFPPDIVESCTRTLDWLFSILLTGLKHPARSGH